MHTHTHSSIKRGSGEGTSKTKTKLGLSQCVRDKHHQTHNKAHMADRMRRDNKNFILHEEQFETNHRVFQNQNPSAKIRRWGPICETKTDKWCTAKRKKKRGKKLSRFMFVSLHNRCPSITVPWVWLWLHLYSCLLCLLKLLFWILCFIITFTFVSIFVALPKHLDFPPKKYGSAEKKHWELPLRKKKRKHLVEIYAIFWLSFKSQLLPRVSLCSPEEMRSLSCNEMPEFIAKANLHHALQ